MSAVSLLAELMAPFVAGSANGVPAADSAKAANPAKGEHSYGPAANSPLCDGLRIAAKPIAGSQAFAGVRNSPDRPTSEQWRRSSQDSRDSQGVSARSDSRRYRLTRAEGDAAHGETWDDAIIVRFLARTALLMRRGLCAGDAEDLAERLHLRDVRCDDRRMCVECSHYRRDRCGNHQSAGLQLPALCRDLAALLQRCPGFQPAM